MAVYLDTSLLVPLFFHETASAAIAMRLRIALLTRDRGQAEGCRFHGLRHEYVEGQS